MNSLQPTSISGFLSSSMEELGELCKSAELGLKEFQGAAILVGSCLSLQRMESNSWANRAKVVAFVVASLFDACVHACAALLVLIGSLAVRPVAGVYSALKWHYYGSCMSQAFFGSKDIPLSACVGGVPSRTMLEKRVGEVKDLGVLAVQDLFGPIKQIFGFHRVYSHLLRSIEYLRDVSCLPGGLLKPVTLVPRAKKQAELGWHPELLEEDPTDFLKKPYDPPQPGPLKEWLDRTHYRSFLFAREEGLRQEDLPIWKQRLRLIASAASSALDAVAHTAFVAAALVGWVVYTPMRIGNGLLRWSQWGGEIGLAFSHGVHELHADTKNALGHVKQWKSVTNWSRVLVEEVDLALREVAGRDAAVREEAVREALGIVIEKIEGAASSLLSRELADSLKLIVKDQQVFDHVDDLVDQVYAYLDNFLRRLEGMHIAWKKNEDRSELSALDNFLSWETFRGQLEQTISHLRYSWHALGMAFSKECDSVVAAGWIQDLGLKGRPPEVEEVLASTTAFEDLRNVITSAAADADTHLAKRLEELNQHRGALRGALATSVVVHQEGRRVLRAEEETSLVQRVFDGIEGVGRAFAHGVPSLGGKTGKAIGRLENWPDVVHWFRSLAARVDRALWETAQRDPAQRQRVLREVFHSLIEELNRVGFGELDSSLQKMVKEEEILEHMEDLLNDVHERLDTFLRGMEGVRVVWKGDEERLESALLDRVQRMILVAVNEADRRLQGLLQKLKEHAEPIHNALATSIIAYQMKGLDVWAKEKREWIRIFDPSAAVDEGPSHSFWSFHTVERLAWPVKEARERGLLLQPEVIAARLEAMSAAQREALSRVFGEARGWKHTVIALGQWEERATESRILSYVSDEREDFPRPFGPRVLVVMPGVSKGVIAAANASREARSCIDLACDVAQLAKEYPVASMFITGTGAHFFSIFASEMASILCVAGGAGIAVRTWQHYRHSPMIEELDDDKEAEIEVPSKPGALARMCKAVSGWLGHAHRPEVVAEGGT